MLLALDTATRLISMALHDGQSVAAESTWLVRKSGSCRLTAISASAWIFPSMRSSSRVTNSVRFTARERSAKSVTKRRSVEISDFRLSRITGR